MTDIKKTANKVRGKLKGKQTSDLVVSKKVVTWHGICFSIRHWMFCLITVLIVINAPTLINAPSLFPKKIIISACMKSCSIL